MSTEEIIFVVLVLTILLVSAAWIVATRDNRFRQFWIDLTGRRTGRRPSNGNDS
jgi:hypothetical protein